ncbi:porin [Pseudorhodoferax sp. Leaf267]|uniref:porin n=1 Tax=Pseudorhodoferax sp. Leaf267 TaxID=1736316 RepID=UPI0009EC1395|nr:porin [Pseudorhodoferax sp. Leaf267]
MKKFAALAVLAAVSASSYAQSSVTLFGIADATVQFGRGNLENNSGMGSGGLNSSRIGFRGVEDLGGGLKAGFWLEAGYNLNNGNGNGQGAQTGLAFKRRSTVSLMGDSWGEVRLGRDFTAVYNNVYDAFGDNGTGAILEGIDLVTYGVQTRTDNAISYFTPKTLGGFNAQLQYYRNGRSLSPTNNADSVGNGYGIRVGYENGPVNVGVAYGETDFDTGAPVVTRVDTKNVNIGGSYDFGVAKLLLTAGQDKGEVPGDSAKTRYYAVGTTVPVGVGLIRAGWTRVSERDSDARADKFAVGYVHNLSKRTALYTTFAYLKNKDGSSLSLNGSSTSAGGNSKGLDIGLRHAF